MGSMNNKQLDNEVTKYRSAKNQYQMAVLTSADIIADFEDQHKELAKENLLTQTFGMHRLLVELVYRNTFTKFARTLACDPDPKRYQSKYIVQKLLELAKDDLANWQAEDEEDERENG